MKRSLHTRFMVLLAILFVGLFAGNAYWSNAEQRAQSEREMLETVRVLALEMDAIWDFMELNQQRFAVDADGNYELYCVVAAKAVSKMFTVASDYTIRYTDLTTRKEIDAPDAFEVQALNALHADPDLEYYYSLVEFPDGSSALRYVEPLYITDSCLDCHGSPAGELDETGYPKEGLALGDIAGAVSIIMPADMYLQNAESSVVREVTLTAWGLTVGFFVFLWFVANAVTRPLGRMSQAARQISDHQFDEVDLDGLGDHDEIAELAANLKSMAEQLNRMYQGLESEVEERTQRLALANRELDARRAELEQANLRLQEEGQYKSDFFATMGHELRTPLTSILAFAEIWKSTYKPSNDDEAKIVQEICLNSQVLLLLVNNILDMARLEAGRQTLDYDLVDLGDVVGAVKAATRGLALRKGLSVTSAVDRDVPVIWADPLAVRRILENLVSNAIKFTDSGGIEIAVSMVPNDAVELRVTDTGRGIPPEQLPTVFERFVQAEDGRGSLGGSGLGLAVVRELAELHGGSVRAHSVLGEGSTFGVILPVGAKPEGGLQ